MVSFTIRPFQSNYFIVTAGFSSERKTPASGAGADVDVRIPVPEGSVRIISGDPVNDLHRKQLSGMRVSGKLQIRIVILALTLSYN